MPLPVAHFYEYRPRPEWGGYYPLGIDIPYQYALDGTDMPFTLALVFKSRLADSKDLSMVHYVDPQVLRLAKFMCNDAAVVQTCEMHDVRDALHVAIDRSRIQPPAFFDAAWIPALENKLHEISALIDTYMEQNIRARQILRTKRFQWDLMASTWKPERMQDWCLDEDEKKDLDKDGLLRRKDQEI